MHGSGEEPAIHRMFRRIYHGADGGLIAGLAFILADMGWSRLQGEPATIPIHGVATVFDVSDKISSTPDDLAIGIFTHAWPKAARGDVRAVHEARVAGVQVVHCTVEKRADLRGSNRNARLFLAAAHAPVRLLAGSPETAVISVSAGLTRAAISAAMRRPSRLRSSRAACLRMRSITTDLTFAPSAADA